MVYLGGKAATPEAGHAMAAEALLPLCSPPVRQLYHTASPLNGSRWLMIPVTDEAVLTDVKELIGIRAAA